MPTPRLRVIVAVCNDEACRRMLQCLDPEFEVVAVITDSTRLVDTVSAFLPDAIICDIFMTGLDGLETTIAKVNARRLSTEKTIPFVLESAGFRFTGISDCPGVIAYVDAIDLAADLALAVRCAALGLKFLSRSIPRSST